MNCFIYCWFFSPFYSCYNGTLPIRVTVVRVRRTRKLATCFPNLPIAVLILACVDSDKNARRRRRSGSGARQCLAVRVRSAVEVEPDNVMPYAYAQRLKVLSHTRSWIVRVRSAIETAQCHDSPLKFPKNLGRGASCGREPIRPMFPQDNSRLYKFIKYYYFINTIYYSSQY